MKTQRELNQKVIGTLKEFIRVIEMVDDYNEKNGTDVEPSFCIKDIDSTLFNIYIKAAHPDDSFTGAVAILFDEQAGVHRPVFPGDVLYHKTLFETSYTVTDKGLDLSTIEYITPFNDIDWTALSWHKPQPKRTFEINGVELPCPFKNHEEEKWILTVSGGVVGNRNRDFKFKSQTERDCVADRIIKILDEARDKP